MQPAIDAVNEWADESGFPFNKNKSYSKILRKNKLNERSRFILGGELINDGDQTK